MVKPLKAWMKLDEHDKEKTILCCLSTQCCTLFVTSNRKPLQVTGVLLLRDRRTTAGGPSGDHYNGIGRERQRAVALPKRVEVQVTYFDCLDDLWDMIRHRVLVFVWCFFLVEFRFFDFSRSYSGGIAFCSGKMPSLGLNGLDLSMLSFLTKPELGNETTPTITRVQGCFGQSHFYETWTPKYFSFYREPGMNPFIVGCRYWFQWFWDTVACART